MKPEACPKQEEEAKPFLLPSQILTLKGQIVLQGIKELKDFSTSNEIHLLSFFALERDNHKPNDTKEVVKGSGIEKNINWLLFGFIFLLSLDNIHNWQSEILKEGEVCFVLLLVDDILPF